MPDFVHRITRWPTTSAITIPANETITAIISTYGLRRLNLFAKAVYPSAGAAGVAISEIYGTDTAWNILNGNPSVPTAALFDNVTAPVTRGTVLPPSGTTGILQWNFDCLAHPGLIQFSLQNLDAALACLFDLYGDCD